MTIAILNFIDDYAAIAQLRDYSVAQLRPELRVAVCCSLCPTPQVGILLSVGHGEPLYSKEEFL